MTHKPTEDTAVLPADRAAWREWLAEHHAQEASVWLILYRQAAPSHNLTYAEAVEEALCFGWVDSKPNKRDEQSYYLFMARRKPKSNWSKLNKDRVSRLEAEGLMTDAGRAVIELARENGGWDALDDAIAGVLPPDFASALGDNAEAKQNFERFPASVTRSILEWIGNARRPETRQARIEETVRLAAQNIRANQYQPLKSEPSKKG